MKSRVGIRILIVLMLSGSLWLFAQVRDFRPVTEAMLRNPAPGDWLNWRRTDNAWGYSPLDQIKRDNVQKLQLAWSWAMEDGAQESTPLVHDGIMYLPNPHGVIQALDAATGDLIWEYQPKDREVTPPTRQRDRRSPAQHRHLRRQGFRDYERRAHHCGGRADRETGVGDSGGGFQARLWVHLRSHRGARQGHRRDQWMQPVQRRRLLHHRA